MKITEDATLKKYAADIARYCDHNHIDNPIEFAKHHEFVKSFDEGLYGAKYWRQIVRGKDIDSYFYDLSLEFRSIWTNLVGFVILDKETIVNIAGELPKKRILEVCCGSAALSKGLYDAGYEVIATDNFSWNFDTRWMFIENIDAVEAVKKYGKDVDYILISWPNYDNPIAYEVLKAMRETNSECQMIYIGEDEGGCTANDDFFENINIIKEDYDIIKTFDGIHDHLIICN